MDVRVILTNAEELVYAGVREVLWISDDTILSLQRKDNSISFPREQIARYETFFPTEEEFQE